MRQHKWIKGISKPNFTYNGIDKGTYKPTLVFNASNDQKSIGGSFYLKQS